MDLYEAIRSLYEEKKKLDKLIASLESVTADGERKARKPAKQPRRRRRFSAERRQEISERMRKYWAARRAQAGSDAEPEAVEVAQAES